MSRTEAREWLDRWREVDERSLEELRRLSLEQKLAQLVSLMRSSVLFQETEEHRDQDRRVAERWMLLRNRRSCVGKR